MGSGIFEYRTPFILWAIFINLTDDNKSDI